MVATIFTLPDAITEWFTIASEDVDACRPHYIHFQTVDTLKLHYCDSRYRYYRTLSTTASDMIYHEAFEVALFLKDRQRGVCFLLCTICQVIVQFGSFELRPPTHD